MLKVSRDRAEQETPTDVVRHPIPRVGVALFDEARDSGWAKLAGGETFRFRAPQDLASDCIWVCQSEDWVFRDKHRGCSHLRMGDYISKLSYIASDLGFRVDGSGKFGARAREACEVLAPTIHRAVVIVAQAYGWSSPAQWLKEDSLMEDIRKFLGEVVPATAIKPWPEDSPSFQEPG